MRKLVALAACAALSTACFPQGQCESSPSFVDYCGVGDPNCQGHIVDATHWESGPMVGNWLTYGPEQTLLMHFRDANTNQVLTGDVANVDVSISAVEQPMSANNQATVCSGNPCEYAINTDSSSVFVKNDTCASYFVRVYVTIEPSADAGTE